MWRFKKQKKKDFNPKLISFLEKAESGFDHDLDQETIWKYDKAFGASAHTTEQNELIDLGRTGNKILMTDKKKIDPKTKKINDYQYAIKEVGAILEQYDHSKQFPTFGFGANP